MPEAGAEMAPDVRDDGQALVGFVDKWRARWPEWAIAEVFVPAAQRPLALAWAALQQELADSAWAGSDPAPGLAKLGWWQEELVGWSRGARRHPLGAVLQRAPAPWGALAASLPSLAGSRDRPGDAAEAFVLVTPFAEAAAAVEAALFGGRETPAADAGAVVAATLLVGRLLLEGDAGVPLSVLARAGQADPRPLWAASLAGRWPAAAGASRPRRIWAALTRARLLQPDPATPLPAWRALLTGWRAAR
jgi:hypothetical protein